MTFPFPKEFLLDMLMSLRLLKNLMSNSAIEKALTGDTLGNHPLLAVLFKVKPKGTDSVPTDSSGKTYKGRPRDPHHSLSPPPGPLPLSFSSQLPYPGRDLGGGGLVAESWLTLATHGL